MPPEPDLLAHNPPPAEYWSPQEKWIWARTLEGEVADFNVRYREAEPLDPKQDDARWSNDEKPRLVSEKFLLDVLGRKPYAEAIPPRGLCIIGARFASALDLMSFHVERQVLLHRSRFEGAVNLVRARFDTSLSFDGSAFNQVLNMSFLTVGQHLTLDGAHFAGDVSLGGAKVEGQLYASGATFEAGLDMNNLTVGQLLTLYGAHFAGDVDLGRAKVDEQLNATGATFEAGLEMTGLKVAELLSLSKARCKGDVYLDRAKVDGPLFASGATFEAGLNMNFITVGRELHLSHATFAGRVSLVFAEVGVLALAGAKFGASVDASGLSAKGELLLDPPPTWDDGAWLVLRNAHVGALNDGGAGGLALDTLGAVTPGAAIENPWSYGHLAALPRIERWYMEFVLRKARALPRSPARSGRRDVGALHVGDDPGGLSLDALGAMSKALGAATENPWPRRGELELDGFSYGRLALPRTVRWYIDDWLARDTSYTPQPYQQLAGVLRAHGDPSGANDVLYAARERERTEAGWQSLVGAGPKEMGKAALRWFGLSLLKWTMGYGLGVRYFRVLPWVVGLTFLGALVLWTSEADQVQSVAGVDRPADTSATEVDLGNEARTALQHQAPSDRKAAAIQVEPKNRNGFVWCLWASFDWMLPFIELDKASSEAVARLQGGPGYLLYFLALVGYVLAGFLAAGLAGLTQSRG